MATKKCEEVSMAMMAIGDGEKPVLAADEIAHHLAHCAECSQEFEQLNSLAKLLNDQKRRELSPDLWPNIKKRLGSPPAAGPAQQWAAFLVLGLLLVIFKLLEMIPERDLGLLFKLVPLLFVIGMFGYFKENPFKINLELTLEGDR